MRGSIQYLSQWMDQPSDNAVAVQIPWHRETHLRADLRRSGGSIVGCGNVVSDVDHDDTQIARVTGQNLSSGQVVRRRSVAHDSGIRRVNCHTHPLRQDFRESLWYRVLRIYCARLDERVTEDDDLQRVVARRSGRGMHRDAEPMSIRDEIHRTLSGVDRRAQVCAQSIASTRAVRFKDDHGIVADQLLRKCNADNHFR